MKRILLKILIGFAIILILIATGLIGVHRTYANSAHYYWILITGIILLTIGYILIRATVEKLITKENKKSELFLETLKNAGKRIIVDFTLCEIKENDYVEEISKHENIATAAQFYNSLDDVDNESDKINMNQAIVIYNHIHEGTAEKYISSILPYDGVTLRYKLEAKKSTMLYIDKQNRKHYYFDFSFLSI